MITADELRRVLDYDPETGAFTWLVYHGKSKFLGLFDRIEDASNAYQRAAVQHFGAFANCTPHKGDEL